MNQNNKITNIINTLYRINNQNKILPELNLDCFIAIAMQDEESFRNMLAIPEFGRFILTKRGKHFSRQIRNRYLEVKFTSAQLCEIRYRGVLHSINNLPAKIGQIIKQKDKYYGIINEPVDIIEWVNKTGYVYVPENERLAKNILLAEIISNLKDQEVPEFCKQLQTYLLNLDTWEFT